MNSVKNKIIIYAAIALILFLTICFGVVYYFLRTFGENYQDDMYRSTICFAESIIDPDTTRNYSITRITDDAYSDTLEKLKDFQKENEECVSRISFYTYNNTGGICIFDTGGEQIGSREEYDEYTGEVMAELINCRNSWTNRRGRELTGYSCVRTVDDQPVGYMIVYIKASPLDKYTTPLTIMYIVMSFFSLLLSAFFAKIMEKRIFKPIRELTETSLSFIGESVDKNAAPKKSSDEIIELGNAINKMFMNLNSGAENLSRAIFDANHDGMTGTLNKRCYHNMADNFKSCSSICILYFDVNNLKLMNDTLGHENGDNVIKRAAEYIKALMGAKDYCFRMGGDEFLLVMTDCSFREMDSIITKLEKESPVILNRDADPLQCALSYGCAYGKGSYDYDSLLAEAEEGMYEKKAELKRVMKMPDR